MKNNTKGELILARQRALACMKQCGIVPMHHILDNQASAAYKTAIETSKMTYQLVPPNNHGQNMAEKAIQTFKNHFVSVLSGYAPTMPIHLWYQLLPQVELQLLLGVALIKSSKIIYCFFCFFNSGIPRYICQ